MITRLQVEPDCAAASPSLSEYFTRNRCENLSLMSYRLMRYNNGLRVRQSILSRITGREAFMGSSSSAQLLETYEGSILVHASVSLLVEINRETSRSTPSNRSAANEQHTTTTTRWNTKGRHILRDACYCPRIFLSEFVLLVHVWLEHGLRSSYLINSSPFIRI